jgi:hypothetical protein
LSGSPLSPNRYRGGPSSARQLDGRPAFQPGGDLVAVKSYIDCSVKLFDASTRSLRGELRGNADPTTDAVFNADGTRLAAGAAALSATRIDAADWSLEANRPRFSGVNRHKLGGTGGDDQQLIVELEARELLFQRCTLGESYLRQRQISMQIHLGRLYRLVL